ncbi:MAG: hypothetical protein JXR66_00665 [Bacteroidales bacterium]|nr:hypothetical protein [Bacteroidales bacterium]MBN2632036.1 hypothetical protein [Bacteroidales bacterium]
MKTKLFLLTAVFAFFAINSCTKQNDIDQESIDLADDEVISEAIFEDVFNSVDHADILLDDYLKGGSTKSFAVTDTCPVVTIDHPDDAIWPKTIVIDFGTLCTGFNGNTKSGKIITVVSGPRREEGSTRSVTFDNYYVNDIKVEGVKVISNSGYNSNQNVVFSVSLTEGKLIFPDGRTVERSFSHEREWLAGFMTRNIWDDECLITGVASGVSIKGIEYSKTISSALHWKRVCKFIVSGVVLIEREGRETAMLDYGSGECDAKAVLTIGDESKEILLKYKR